MISGYASKTECKTTLTLYDILDGNDALDIQEEADRKAADEQRREAKEKGR